MKLNITIELTDEQIQQIVHEVLCIGGKRISQDIKENVDVKFTATKEKMVPVVKSLTDKSIQKSKNTSVVSTHFDVYCRERYQ